MKLSGHRGKVVVLYLSPYFSFPIGDRMVAKLADGFRKLDAGFAGKPLAIVGVTTWHATEPKGVPEQRHAGPLLMDPSTPNNRVGPIHAAWDMRPNAAATYYVLDPRGTIRYHLPGDLTLIEKAVTRLLEEPQPARPPG